MIFYFSLACIIYACLGLFGIQHIPKEYRGTALEKPYKRFSGIAFLILGIAWLLGDILVEELSVAQILLLALPAVVISVIGDIHYRCLLKTM